MCCIPVVHRVSTGGARISSAHLWWALLLDLYVLISQMAMSPRLDRRMCDQFVPLKLLPCSYQCPIDSNTIGNIAGVASVDWGCAVQIMAAASIGSGLTFTATIGQTLYVQSPLLYHDLCTYTPFLAQFMSFCYSAMQ